MPRLGSCCATSRPSGRARRRARWITSTASARSASPRTSPVMDWDARHPPARPHFTGAARRRLRPIVMTSVAMVVGMLPTALAIGEGGDQAAPLGIAVIGGLVASTLATLLVTPALYVAFGRAGKARSPSLHPDDLSGGQAA